MKRLGWFGVGLGAGLVVRDAYRAFKAATRPEFDLKAALLKRRVEVGAVDSSSARGILLDAIRRGAHAPIEYVSILAPELDLWIDVASDAVKAEADGRLLRLPVTYAETIEACRILGAGQYIAPSKKLCDAMYAAATQTVFHTLVQRPGDDQKMGTLGFVKKYNDGIDAQLAKKGYETGLIAGAWKYWILNRRLVETIKETGLPAAINYGGWSAKGAPLQSVGGRHDIEHLDYSQLLQPVRRWARNATTGESVDLLRWIEDNEGVPSRFTDAFREGVS